MLKRFFKRIYRTMFRMPRVGDVWRLEPTNPWHSRVNHYKVCDIRRGWVRMRCLETGHVYDTGISLLCKVFELHHAVEDTSGDL